MKIVGMIPVYNESDIIESNIEHLVSQGIDLVILDNASTDGSYEICSRYVGKGVISLEKLETERYELGLLLERIYRMALAHKPDWVLLSDADTFLESPYCKLTLKGAIESDDHNGHNLIRFNNFEFWPTERDRNSSESDVRKRIRYYTWNDDLQFRCWKVYPDTEVVPGGGHYPKFQNNVKIALCPTKYALRHYRVRSYQHGLRKIFDERLPRYSKMERSKGWHLHYDKFGRDESFFIIDSRNLNKYEDDGKWSVKKTFDWTWGLQGRPWANPPVKRGLSVRIAERFPFVARMWKALFLRKYRRSVRKTKCSSTALPCVASRNWPNSTLIKRVEIEP